MLCRALAWPGHILRALLSLGLVNPAGDMERSLANLASPDVDLSPVTQQRLHHGGLARLDSQVESGVIVLRDTDMLGYMGTQPGYLVTFVAASTFSPFTIREFTTATWPLEAAVWIPRAPLLLGISRGTPFLNKI